MRLRVRWRAGQTTRYEIVTTQDIEAPAPGRPGLSRRTEAVAAVETLSVTPDGTATQRMRLESVRLASGSLSPGERGPLVEALRAARMSYRQDPRGAVVGAPQGQGLEGAGEVRSTVEGMLTALLQLGPTLPEGPVRVGDGWDERSEARLAPAPGGDLTLTLARHHTLRSWRLGPEGAVAELDTTWVLRTPEGRAVGQIPMRGEGAGQGRTRLDLGRGVVVDSRVQGTMSVRLTVRGNELTVRSRFDNTLRELAAGDPGEPSPRGRRRRRSPRRGPHGR